MTTATKRTGKFSKAILALESPGYVKPDEKAVNLEVPIEYVDTSNSLVQHALTFAEVDPNMQTKLNRFAVEIRNAGLNYHTEREKIEKRMENEKKRTVKLTAAAEKLGMKLVPVSKDGEKGVDKDATKETVATK